jgi:hypothetical protein
MCAAKPARRNRPRTSCDTDCNEDGFSDCIARAQLPRAVGSFDPVNPIGNNAMVHVSRVMPTQTDMQSSSLSKLLELPPQP